MILLLSSNVYIPSIIVHCVHYHLAPVDLDGAPVYIHYGPVFNASCVFIHSKQSGATSILVLVLDSHPPLHLCNSLPHFPCFGDHEQMAVWYLTWGVLAYVMTLGKSSRQARDWVFTGQIVMLAAEMAIVTTPGGGGVLPSWLFPRMAEYEVRFCR